jgi:WD40 repeat protein
MRFDCRQLNDVLSLWPNPDQQLIISACNDGYIRTFNLRDVVLVSTIKSSFGAPLCLDLSRDQNLLAAGFEDDSFVLYSTNFGLGKGLFTPLCRGLGHKSFVC